MADTDAAPILATNQITTTDLTETPAGPPPEAGSPPPGTMPGAAPGDHTAITADTKEGVGIEGEMVVWEARYSMRNFIGRLILGGLFAVGWIAMALYAWGFEHTDNSLTVLTILLGLIPLFYWLNLAYRILLARYGHYYRLTTRRLFVSSGLFSRRRDMMELLKVQDVYTRQSLAQRWLSLGTVVVVSSDHKLPVLNMPGVDDPKGVMDTIWHYARAERDQKSVKVDRI